MADIVIREDETPVVVDSFSRCLQISFGIVNLHFFACRELAGAVVMVQRDYKETIARVLAAES